MAITGADKPERIYGALTSANYFEVLGVSPFWAERWQITAANERAGAPEAVLGYDLWQHRFGGDPADRGKDHPDQSSHLHDRGRGAARFSWAAKAGCAPRSGFRSAWTRQIWNWNPDRQPRRSWLKVLGVLRPGVSQPTRPKRTQSADAAHRRSLPGVASGRQPDLAPIRSGARRSAPTFTLAGRCRFCWRWPAFCCCWPAPTWPICCWCARFRAAAECAIRLSMGASRWRLVRQLLVENLLDRPGRRRGGPRRHLLDGPHAGLLSARHHSSHRHQREGRRRGDAGRRFWFPRSPPWFPAWRRRCAPRLFLR